MCHFITLVVSGSDTDSIDRVLRRFGRRAEPVANPSITRILDGREAQYLTTVGGCDCGTVLARRAAAAPPDPMRQAAKLAKKGWSRAKIERWLADRGTADARRETHAGAAPDSFELWENAISALLELPGVGAAGVLLHLYEGALASEDFSPRRKRVTRPELAAALRDLAEDELLVAARR
jgi:hypothetical protein